MHRPWSSEKTSACASEAGTVSDYDCVQLRPLLNKPINVYYFMGNMCRQSPRESSHEGKLPAESFPHNASLESLSLLQFC